METEPLRCKAGVQIGTHIEATAVEVNEQGTSCLHWFESEGESVRHENRCGERGPLKSLVDSVDSYESWEHSCHFDGLELFLLKYVDGMVLQRSSVQN